MPEAFTLWRQRGGDVLEKELREWGIEQPVLKLTGLGMTGQADDSLTCAITALVDAEPAFARNDRVELFGEDGTRRFVGWARRAKPSASAPAEKHAFTFESPSRFLRSDYLAAANVITEGGYEQLLISSTILGTDNRREGGDPVIVTLTLRDTIAAILTFGQTYGDGGSAAPFDFDLAAIPDTLRLPVAGKESSSMLACIEAVLALAPSINFRWDYATKLDGTRAGRGARPVLRAMNFVSIDLATGEALSPPTLLPSSGAGRPVVHDIPNDGTVLESFEPEPLDERIIRRLDVFFTSEDGVSDHGDAGTGRALAYTQYTSVIENGSVLAKALTLPARSVAWTGTGFATPEAAPETHLARLLHMGFDRVWWQFSANTGAQHRDANEEFHWEWRPGDLANLTGAGSELAAAFAMMQTITRNLFTGAEQLATGSPVQRGLGELAALRRAVLGVPSDSGGGGQQFGFGPPKGGDVPGAPGATGATGATPTLAAGTLTVDAAFEVIVTPSALTPNDYAISLKIKPVSFASVSIDTTGGSSSGEITGNWADGFNLALHLNIPPGAPGTPGTPGTVIDTVSVNVTGLAAGEAPTGSGSIAGTTLTINLGIPAGATGATGEVSTAAMNTAIDAAIAALLAANPGLTPP